MQLADIIGTATATVKHPTLDGQKLLIAQPLGADKKPDGDPVIVVDSLGCGTGDRVMYTSDGSSVRDMLGSKTTPVRYAILGIAD